MLCAHAAHVNARHSSSYACLRIQGVAAPVGVREMAFRKSMGPKPQRLINRARAHARPCNGMPRNGSCPWHTPQAHRPARTTTVFSCPCKGPTVRSLDSLRLPRGLVDRRLEYRPKPATTSGRWVWQRHVCRAGALLHRHRAKCQGTRELRPAKQETQGVDAGQVLGTHIALRTSRERPTMQRTAVVRRANPKRCHPCLARPHVPCLALPAPALPCRHSHGLGLQHTSRP